MKRSWILCGLIAISSFASADTSIYTPVMSIKDQHISLGSWGSGTIAQTTEAAFQGVDSIRVSTTNLFQGGIIYLAHPIDLSSQFSSKDNLLRLTFLTPTGNTVYGSSGIGGGKLGGMGVGGLKPGGMGLPGGPGSGAPPPGIPGGFPGGAGGGPGRRGGPGGPGSGAPPPGMQGGFPGGPGGGKLGGGFPGVPGGGPGGPGGFGGLNTKAPKVLKEIRLVITTSDGKKSEIYLPADVAANKDGWKKASVPIDAIRGFANTNKQIVSIAVSGDRPSTIYVGQLDVVSDPTPITGDIAPTATNLALGDQLTLTGEGFAGASQLEYEWNFGDGTQIDATGQSVVHTFRSPGTFLVTLTIADKYGMKAPYKTTVSITVNP